MNASASTIDRRSFLRRAGVAAVVAPAAPLLGCARDPSEAAEGAGGTPVVAGAITRPVLLPWSDGAVRIDAPPHEMPVAYVSLGRRELFVDWAFRDRVYWALRAHISVSTEVWRIPLVGDPPREPISPGDSLREFVELSERDWDPALPPALGDFRIQRGAASARRVDIACAPLVGGGAWFNAGPWDIQQCSGPTEQLCREDFISIGTGMRYADRDCTRSEGSVDFLTWACRPGLNPTVG